MIELDTRYLGRTPTTLVPTIERMVYGNQRTQMNRLNEAGFDSTETDLTFEFDADGIRPGAYLEVDDEVMFVWSVAGQVATVERGMLGSTAAAHDSGAIVRVEPRFFRVELAEQIATEIRSWPTNVYARAVGSLSAGAAIDAIDLMGLGDMAGLSLLRVQHRPTTAVSQRWNRLDSVRLERRQAETSFGSGYALVLPAALGTPSTLRIVLRAPFDTANLTPTTDLGDVGLTNDLVDIIPWGVAARLLMTRDIARTDANPQGRSRPAEEVRTGDATQVGRALMQERDRLLAEAANRLLAEDGMGWA